MKLYFSRGDDKWQEISYKRAELYARAWDVQMVVQNQEQYDLLLGMALLEGIVPHKPRIGRVDGEACIYLQIK
jgi:hypothetical protein